MRESWRHDLDRWKAEIGLKRVRFHGIFNDEMGVYTPTILNRNKPTPNFRNIPWKLGSTPNTPIDPVMVDGSA